ncbi:MAG: hypothetical protein IPM21_08040 [Acidobacteria bacterium]|nr:hypothetical protein [Acidobacteriota bacterium]
MMQQQQAMAAAEARQCFGCNFEAVSAETACPRCGKSTFFTAGNIRTRGGILVGLGLFVAVLIGAVSVVVGLIVLNAMNDPSKSRQLAEDQHILLAAAGLFAVLILFGVHMIVSGGWMLAFGKRNRHTVWVMWILLAMVFVFGAVFRFLT